MNQIIHSVRENISYITVGTGIGVGAVINKKVVNGLVHPEGGHMILKKREDDKDFEGNCPFHKDNCLEGLATNNSLAKRLNATEDILPTLR